MATATMTAPDWSISLQNAVSNSPVLFKTEADYVNKQLDSFYKSSDYQTLAKQGYTTGDYSSLQSKINSIKTSASTSYNKVKVPTNVASSRGRALLTLAELGVGLIPAIYDYFSSKSPATTSLPVSNSTQNASIAVNPETSKVDLSKFVPEYSATSSLISVLDSANIIQVSMLGQVQNSLVDLTNSVDLQTVALVSSIYDLTNAVANIGSSVSDSSSYLNMINDSLVNLASKENITPVDLVSVVNALSDIARSNANQSVSINFDTAGIESAISELKPTNEMNEVRQKHYEKSYEVNDYLTTSKTLEVLPTDGSFSAVSVSATPLEVQTSKNLQDAHYRSAQNSFKYDDEDFDDNLSGFSLPKFYGITGMFEAGHSFVSDEALPDTFKVLSSDIPALGLFNCFESEAENL